MKNGDKLYCHTTYTYYISNKEIFKKGKLYDIFFIDNITVGLLSEIPNVRWEFYLNTKNIDNPYTYKDYFYAPKEVRKLKLQNLENWG